MLRRLISSAAAAADCTARRERLGGSASAGNFSKDTTTPLSLSGKPLVLAHDSLGEAAGTDEQGLQDYLLRELMSEGYLRYQTAQRVGNEIQTLVIEKHGPVCFMVTTTKRKLHPENETRMLSLDIDDSEDQTRAVLKKIAQNEGSNDAAALVDFEPWQDFQRWLAAGERRVLVPYAETLADAIPPRSVRLRRDFGQVLHAIKAHALLHRQHRALNLRGAIIANIDHDYAAVRELMHDLLAETSEVKIKASVIETIDVVSELTKGLDDKSGTTAKAVGKKLRLDRSTALRRLQQAEDGGFVTNLEERRGRPGKYRCTGEQVEAIDMMPTVEALKAACHDTSRATTQPDNRGRLGPMDQGHRDCRPDCNQDCNQSPSGVVANAVARPLATTETRTDLPKTEQRLQGCTVAAQDACDAQIDIEEFIAEVDREERLAIQHEPAADPLETPPWLGCMRTNDGEIV